MAVTASLVLSATARQTAPRDLGSASDAVSLTHALAVADGTGPAQADRLWSDTRTLAASASEDLDLNGTALLDAFGSAATFPKVTGMIIRAAAGNTNNLVIGAAAASPWAALLSATGTVTLRPGACFAVLAGSGDASGWAVTAGTGDLLKIANGGAGSPVSYDIVVLGKSA